MSDFPFTPHVAESVAALGEIKLIEAIRSWLGPTSPSAPYGIGDDCAIAPTPAAGCPLLTTVDGVLYGVHFDETLSAELAGAKLVNRNLSDLAAMGAYPLSGLLTLIAPPQLKQDWLERFYAGIKITCDLYAFSIIGGDIATGPAGFFSAHLFLMGTTPLEVQPLLRQGGQASDIIAVTGTLGGSLIRKHALFRPRLEEGLWLAKQSGVHAAIDITDGLASDLPKLLPTDGLAALDLNTLPFSDEAHEMALRSGKSVIEHACCDGEDYELAIMVDQKHWPDVFNHWPFETPLTAIGTVLSCGMDSDSGHKLYDSRTKQPLLFRGYEHL